MKPFEIVKEFEREVAAYANAPYAVAVNSCTNAIFLSLMWLRMQSNFPQIINIPKRTYVSIPQQILHAGAVPNFTDEDWSGIYQLAPLPLWDSARRFTSGMYAQLLAKCYSDSRTVFMCTSHHWSKTLGVQQGGCILHNSLAADIWLRRARFDGRTEGIPPKDDKDLMIGWHMYMSPEVAAEGLVRLSHLPAHNADLPEVNYPDLSTFKIFQ